MNSSNEILKYEGHLFSIMVEIFEMQCLDFKLIIVFYPFLFQCFSCEGN